MIEGEGRDGVRGVFADTGQVSYLVQRFRESLAMSIYDELCGGVKISRASVVAETLPGAQNFAFRCSRETTEMRKAPKPLSIVRQNRRDLRLLEHEFGNEDAVRIARATPWKVAPIVAIPTQKPTAELRSIHSQHSITKNMKGTKK